MAESFEQATTQNPGHKKLEQYVPGMRLQNGLFTELPVVIDNNLTVNGTITGGSTNSTSTNLVVTTLATINNLVVSGTVTFVGGFAGVNQLVGANVNWSLGGAPAAPSTGNNTTMVAGTAYWVQMFLEADQTLTGLEFLTGTTAGTDQWIGSLYNIAGTPVAVTALQTVTSLVNQLEKFPFTSTYKAPGPGYYFITLQSSGTTNKFQSYTVPGAAYNAGSIAGTTSTQAVIATLASAGYTNNVGPVSCVY